MSDNHPPCGHRGAVDRNGVARRRGDQYCDACVTAASAQRTDGAYSSPAVATTGRVGPAPSLSDYDGVVSEVDLWMQEVDTDSPLDPHRALFGRPPRRGTKGRRLPSRWYDPE